MRDLCNCCTLISLTYFCILLQYIRAHIQSVIEHYEGGLPLTHFLRNYFRLHPKLGSRDRKILSEMAYCWYRCSKAVDASVPFFERLGICLFLCETSLPQVRAFIPEPLREGGSDLEEKKSLLKRLGISFRPDAIAPFSVELSEGISYEAWQLSMLRQPRLFIRTRKDEGKVLTILQGAGITFQQVRDHCLSLPNGTAVDKLLPPELYVVQDASSQATGDLLNPRSGESWWDCCSGAGGKSLLLKDLEPRVNLTVSDKRPTILSNLAERFRLYGHRPQSSLAVDMSEPAALYTALKSRSFDGIIADVPCTGSGTWFRTPEQLYHFRQTTITQFSALQKQIALNAAAYLRQGGKMVYITCSIFREENEEVVSGLAQEGGLKVVQSGLINGLEIGADCMFAAVLRK